MQYEWGPWIEHDGKGCSVKGQYGVAETAEGVFVEKVFGTWEGPEDGIPIDCWNWSCPNLRMLDWDARVIRYRVRSPRVSEWLDQVASDLPVEVHA